MAGPSRELYRSGPVAVGTFRCRPQDQAFAGGWMDHPTIVFPRTCVKITQEGADTVLADPNTVVLYRGCQEYSRRMVDAVGDHCEWFEVDPAWLRDAAAPFDPEVTDPSAPPVRRTHGPASAQAYGAQRALIRLLLGDADPDRLQIEEALLTLVDLVIPLSYHAESGQRPGPLHRDLVDDAKAVMATRFGESLSLEDIGAAVGASQFHLARTFRRVTGQSMHQYLTSLRLRVALGHLEDDRRGIAEIAVAVGFSSHSHFSQAFRASFGATPSAVRRRPEVVLPVGPAHQQRTQSSTISTVC